MAEMISGIQMAVQCCMLFTFLLLENILRQNPMLHNPS